MLSGQPSVTMDAVIVPDGRESVATLARSGAGRYYLQEAYKHLKVIALVGDGRDMLQAASLDGNDEGVIVADDLDDLFDPFVELLGKHRVWARNAAANDMPA
jgi:catalase